MFSPPRSQEGNLNVLVFFVPSQNLRLTCMLKIALASEWTPPRPPPGLTGPRASSPACDLSALQLTLFLRMASPLAVSHLLKFTKHLKVINRRLTEAAPPLPGSPAHAHR